MTIIARLQKRAIELVGAPGSLRGRVARSASWVSVGYGTEMVLRLGSSLVLTRLLSPAAFGIMATAQVFLFTAVMLSDVGIRSLVITHERSNDPEFLQTVWTFQIIRGVILAAIVALLGQGLGVAQRLGWLAPENSFAGPTLPAIIAVLGITLAFEGLKSTNEHVMARDLRQDVLVKLEVSTKLLSTLITVAAVWITRSVWGFVYAALLVAMLRAVLSLLIVPGPRMQIAWNRNDISYVINRGKWIGVSSWTALAGSLADKILIGSFFGSSVLGLYTLALSLADALHSIMTKITNAIALPTIRHILQRSRDQFRHSYQRIRNAAQIGSSLVGFALILLGSLLVESFYDERYAAAGNLLAIIAFQYFIFHLRFNIMVMQARRQFRAIAAFGTIRIIFLWFFAFAFAQASLLQPLVVLFALNLLIERGLASFLLARDNLLNPRSEMVSYVTLVAVLVMGFFVYNASFWL